jgi:hypothetical protein
LFNKCYFLPFFFFTEYFILSFYRLVMLPFKLSLTVFPDLFTVSPPIKLTIFNLLRFYSIFSLLFIILNTVNILLLDLIQFSWNLNHRGRALEVVQWVQRIRLRRAVLRLSRGRKSGLEEVKQPTHTALLRGYVNVMLISHYDVFGCPEN